MHCSSLEMHSYTLVQVKACWCFSLYYQGALSRQYCYSQLLSQGKVCLLSVWKERVFKKNYLPLLHLPIIIAFERLMIFITWRFKLSHWSTMIPERELRCKLRATEGPCLGWSPEPVCPDELLVCFMPWFWPKSSGTLSVSGNGFGALWGWHHFP